MPALQGRFWTFTDYTLELFKKFDGVTEVRFAQWQLEKCPTTEKLHHQGFVQLKSQKSMTWLKKNLDATAHWEFCKGSEAANERYTSKCETRVEGPWTYGEKVKSGTRTDLKVIAESVKTIGAKRTIQEMPEAYLKCGKKLKELEQILKPVRPDKPEVELYEWQQRVMLWLSTPIQKREIMWIWSEASGKGKSTFYDYVASEYNVLKGDPEMKRTLYAYDDHQVIWFDIPRQTPLDADFTSQLEALANQTTHLSSMFSPMMKLVKAKLIVTCNRPPPFDKLPGRLCEIRVD